MTEDVLHLFGVNSQDYTFQNTAIHSPGTVKVEGDWSNGAFFLGAQSLDNTVEITGLNPASSQGDRQALSLMRMLSEFSVIDGRDTPDLIPILAVVAGAKKGARFENIERLRLKESDRIESVAAMLKALGCKVETGKDFLAVYPAAFHGCVIDSCNDHRIAMSAAIASTVASGPVTILDAKCVSKSYPDFWAEFLKLGGYYEQYIR